MNGISYKGFGIRPAPMELADTGQWNMEVYISKDSSGGIKERKFTAGNTFDTKKEAIDNCINFGRQIIDGTSENCSVDDL